MKKNLFFVSQDGSEYTYDYLIEDFYSCTSVPRYCYSPDIYTIVKNILFSLLHEKDLILLDSDFSRIELISMGVDPDMLSESLPVIPRSIDSKATLIRAINNINSWKLTLFTSGTTGLPKRVTHRFDSLKRPIRQSMKHEHDVWALAYNPTHIAGVQVFFQAVMNGNLLIDVFGMPKSEVFNRICEYQITNISATPTFYRMLMPVEGQYQSVIRITSGGERFDSKLTNNIIQAFPNAQLRNIYATTEAGSVLESKNDKFSISDPTRCKIDGNHIYINSSLVGLDEMTDEWYDTGDIVEIVDNQLGEFVFVGRASEMINVGGYNANPYEIEEILCSHSAVIKAKVWGKPNTLIGNLLMAELVCNRICLELEIREFLKGKLQDYKIPRVINFVDDIKITRSGKIKRVS